MHPDAVRHIAALPNLEELQLAQTNVTSEMIAFLSGHRTLKCFRVNATAVDAAVFSKMKPLPLLRILEIGGKDAPLTDEGLAAIIVACPALGELSSNGSRLTAAGYASLRNLRALGTLRLAGITLDDASVGILARMKDLRVLEMNGSSLTDSQVALLQPLKGSLGELHLRDTRITDACIPALKKMEALRVLLISGTDITKAGADALRAALPGCRIEY
jgi:hypothetical protein